jgi:aquaporin Z
MTLAASKTPPAWRFVAALRSRWRIYLAEAALLGLFMISAGGFTVLFEYPGSAVHQSISSPFVRRGLIGVAMGLTAIALIYSRPGKRSGAHMNPAVTLCFLRLGKIDPADAAFYIAAQFIGGAAGVGLCRVIAKPLIAHPAINHVVTLPGPQGIFAAWIAECAISFALMGTVLTLNRFPKLMGRTGIAAGILVALYITFEAPFSGMSMNPARTMGSALFAHTFTGLWIYFTAPIAGMLAAVETYRLLMPDAHRICGKLTHCHRVPCIIKCNCMAPPGIEMRGN